MPRPPSPGRALVIVSNRGPAGYRFAAEGRPVPSPPAGGLATGLRPLLGEGTTWVASALSDADRAAVAAGGATVTAAGLSVRMLAVDPVVHRLAYDVVANATLWFLHHGLWDLPRRPAFDHHWNEAWAAFRTFNDVFAEAVAEVAEPGAAVLVQDYHLCMVAERLHALRPELSAVHFSHTPFTGPEGMQVLPDAVADELLGAMARFDGCGFHSERWAARFRSCYEDRGARPPPTFSAPLAPDLDGLRDVAAGSECGQRLADLDELVAGRAVIARVDRLELSKNVLRGFSAYEELLGRRRDLHGQVVFLALLYPSREGVLDYLAYEQEVTGLAARVNARFGSTAWKPIELVVGDDFPRSVAALRRYDVLLVNPVRDGLNLVAHEGPAVNERAGVVCLSRQAGAFDRLGPAVEPVHPFDITQTSLALERALDMPLQQREEQAAHLRELVLSWTPAAWLEANLAAAR